MCIASITTITVDIISAVFFFASAENNIDSASESRYLDF